MGPQKYATTSNLVCVVWPKLALEAWAAWARYLFFMKRTTVPELLPPLDPTEHHRWLEGIVPLQEGALLRGTSVDTLKREHRRGRVKLERISERLWGIRRRVALMK
jgi:hypothetical protein